MASRSSALVRPPVFRGIGRSILLTLPMALWSLLIFTPSFRQAGRIQHIGAAAVILFMTASSLSPWAFCSQWDSSPPWLPSAAP